MSVRSLHEVSIAVRMLTGAMHAVRVAAACRHCRAVHFTPGVSWCSYGVNNVDNILKYIRRSDVKHSLACFPKKMRELQ